MEFSPYQKILAYISLLEAFLVGVVISISAFITHTDQPVGYGSILILTTWFISMIIIGLMQVRSARKQGRFVLWYKQYEVTLGSACLCFLLLAILAVILPPLLPFTHLLFYLQIVIWGILALSGFIFFGLSIKYRPDRMKTK